MSLLDLTPLPGSRFLVSDFPAALPSKCVVCGNPGGDGRKFVEFGFELDFFGVIYFCSVCLVECSNSLGYVSPDQWKVACEENNRLSEKIGKLEAENVRLRNGLSELNFLGILPSNVEDVADSEFLLSEPEVFHGKSDISERQDDSGSPESSDESESESLSDDNGNVEESGNSIRDFDDDFRI